MRKKVIVKNIIQGGGDLFIGAKILITTPRLWTFVWVPIIINTVVYAAVFGFGIYYFNDLLAYLLPNASTWYMEVFRALAWVGFVVILAVIMFLTFFAIANIISAPFNEKLSRKYEELQTGRRVEGDISVFSSMKQEAKRVLSYLAASAAVGVVTFAASFIPILNVAIPVVWAIFSGIVLSLDFLSYALDRHNFKFDEKVEYMRTNFSRCGGFGISIYLALMVPLLNVTIIPCAVVGATRLFLKTEGYENMKEGNILVTEQSGQILISQ